MDSAGEDESSGPAYDPAELTKGAPSRHLWLGNLHQRLPRSLLRSTFERFGPVEDVVTFPGRMYAFVNFREPADAAKAAQAVQVSEKDNRQDKGLHGPAWPLDSLMAQQPSSREVDFSVVSAY
jgi:hypothetical protein